MSEQSGQLDFFGSNGEEVHANSAPVIPEHLKWLYAIDGKAVAVPRAAVSCSFLSLSAIMSACYRKAPNDDEGGLLDLTREDVDMMSSMYQSRTEACREGSCPAVTSNQDCFRRIENWHKW